MTVIDQLQKMGVHIEVKCPTHYPDPDKSHTLTEFCDDARIQWVQMSGSITKKPEEGWKENYGSN
jgi:hypothetical protein